ncbi:hypothetical protein AMS68_003253 [Peltaster fructicola]|uniref:Uncharacterized protein n=1 Tax=Peltaster fructicola TaxID=286661 RepID=A0A6H0XST5_9PEZI|nr:hypothetical protein AMS68_003253 [Peltaster fructicola]
MCLFSKTRKSKAREVQITGTSRDHIPLPVVEVILGSWDRYDWQRSSDAITAWFNARWAKTGYRVSNEVMCFTLRLHGRDAVMGLSIPTDGTR